MGGISGKLNNLYDQGWKANEYDMQLDKHYEEKYYQSYVPDVIDMYEYIDFSQYPETCAMIKTLYDKKIGFFVRAVDGVDVYACKTDIEFDEVIKNKCYFVCHVPYVYDERIQKVFVQEREAVRQANAKDPRMEYEEANRTELEYLGYFSN
jgi:hypothetical protein